MMAWLVDNFVLTFEISGYGLVMYREVSAGLYSEPLANKNLWTAADMRPEVFMGAPSEKILWLCGGQGDKSEYLFLDS